MPTDAEDNELPSPLTDDQQSKALKELIRRHRTQLSEHFSSVQIICTQVRPEGSTRRYDAGSGDIYSRCGATREWLVEAERPVYHDDDE